MFEAQPNRFSDGNRVKINGTKFIISHCRYEPYATIPRVLNTIDDPDKFWSSEKHRPQPTKSMEIMVFRWPYTELAL